jgi:hypothetical protein
VERGRLGRRADPPRMANRRLDRRAAPPAPSTSACAGPIAPPDRGSPPHNRPSQAAAAVGRTAVAGRSGAIAERSRPISPRETGEHPARKRAGCRHRAAAAPPWECRAPRYGRATGRSGRPATASRAGTGAGSSDVGPARPRRKRLPPPPHAGTSGAERSNLSGAVSCLTHPGLPLISLEACCHVHLGTQ